MKKLKKLLLIPLLISCLLLSGCWDYWGMNELNILAGIAVDKGKEDGLYHITMEIVDVSALKDKASGAKSIFVEATGSTIFEAARNSKKRLINKTYFGSMRCMIIGKDLAQTEGVKGILDGFLRDGEPRETLNVVISCEDTAKSLMTATGLDFTSVSYEMNIIIQEDPEVTSASKQGQMYQAFNTLGIEGGALALPAFRSAQNKGEAVVEANGIALFDGDKLIDFLSPEDALPYLIIEDECKGGALSFGYHEGEAHNISTEIKQCKSKTEYAFVDGKFHMMLHVKMDLGIIEIHTPMRSVDADARAYLAGRAASTMENRLLRLLRDMQVQPGIDVFGFGNLVYRENPALWSQIRDRWPEIFRAATFQVEVDINLVNTGIIAD